MSLRNDLNRPSPLSEEKLSSHSLGLQPPLLKRQISNIIGNISATPSEVKVQQSLDKSKTHYDVITFAVDSSESWSSDDESLPQTFSTIVMGDDSQLDRDISSLSTFYSIGSSMTFFGGNAHLSMSDADIASAYDDATRFNLSSPNADYSSSTMNINADFHVSNEDMASIHQDNSLNFSSPINRNRF